MIHKATTVTMTMITDQNLDDNHRTTINDLICQEKSLAKWFTSVSDDTLHFKFLLNMVETLCNSSIKRFLWLKVTTIYWLVSSFTSSDDVDDILTLTTTDARIQSRIEFEAEMDCDEDHGSDHPAWRTPAYCQLWLT